MFKDLPRTSLDALTDHDFYRAYSQGDNVSNIFIGMLEDALSHNQRGSIEKLFEEFSDSNKPKGIDTLTEGKIVGLTPRILEILKDYLNQNLNLTSTNLNVIYEITLELLLQIQSILNKLNTEESHKLNEEISNLLKDLIRLSITTRPLEFLTLWVSWVDDQNQLIRLLPELSTPEVEKYLIEAVERMATTPLMYHELWNLINHLQEPIPPFETEGMYNLILSFASKKAKAYIQKIISTAKTQEEQIAAIATLYRPLINSGLMELLNIDRNELYGLFLEDLFWLPEKIAVIKNALKSIKDNYPEMLKDMMPLLIQRFNQLIAEKPELAESIISVRWELGIQIGEEFFRPNSNDPIQDLTLRVLSREIVYSLSQQETYLDFTKISFLDSYFRLKASNGRFPSIFIDLIKRNVIEVITTSTEQNVERVDYLVFNQIIRLLTTLLNQRLIDNNSIDEILSSSEIIKLIDTLFRKKGYKEIGSILNRLDQTYPQSRALSELREHIDSRILLDLESLEATRTDEEIVGVIFDIITTWPNWTKPLKELNLFKNRTGLLQMLFIKFQGKHRELKELGGPDDVRFALLDRIRRMDLFTLEQLLNL